MKVDAALLGKSEAPGPEDLAIGRRQNEIEIEPRELVKELALVELDGLLHFEPVRLGVCFYRRGAEREASSGRAVRLGNDADDLVAGIQESL